jgi:DnaJ-class molecular chaperone
MGNICESCQGAGEWPLDDCEDGDWDTCPYCGGYGFDTEEDLQ